MRYWICFVSQNQVCLLDQLTQLSVRGRGEM